MREGTAFELATWLLGSADQKKIYRIEENKRKRSKGQNAYYWDLVTKMADKSHIPKPEIHNRLMRLYGRDFEICGERVGRYFPDTDETEETMLRAETYHFRPTAKVKEGKRVWVLLKASHDMDTAEMSALLDGAIIEAKEMEIDTDGIEKEIHRDTKGRERKGV